VLRAGTVYSRAKTEVDMEAEQHSELERARAALPAHQRTTSVLPSKQQLMRLMSSPAIGYNKRFYEDGLDLEEEITVEEVLRKARAPGPCAPACAVVRSGLT
jgi:hypothetical protein